MLFNEPKLLKWICTTKLCSAATCFSALQRAEIAEILRDLATLTESDIRFSALQRAEIAEIETALTHDGCLCRSFSALQRAEIAEILRRFGGALVAGRVSVLFNEPKLLKSAWKQSAVKLAQWFQCSSTSRNC